MPSRAQLVTLLALASTRAQGPDEVVITEGPGYRVQFDVVTKAGPSKFVVHVRQQWAPYAAARFLELVRAGHFDDSRFMIVVPDRFTHFGISGDPQKQAARLLEQIKPEETAAVAKRNTAGRIAFVPSSDASAAPKSKTKKTMGLDKIIMPEVSWGEKDGAGSTQVMIHTANNTERFEGTALRPFGEIEGGGLSVVRALYAHQDQERPLDLQRVIDKGNEYLDEEFPELSKIVRATVLETWNERQLLVPKALAMRLKDEV